MPDPLIVRLSGTPIGILTPTGTFEWATEWASIAPLNSVVLSQSLPFGSSRLNAGPFFGGVLPEGRGLDQLARESRVASNDLFGLLSEVGADVGGAVTIGEPRPPREPIALGGEDYGRILAEAAGYIRGSAVGGGGSAATGIQPKVALTWDPGAQQWLIGRGSTPSTHLLKPVAEEYSERLHAEAYLNEVASALGMASHRSRVEPAGEQVVLVIERYDRVREDSGIRRLHQEDAAQALGLPWGGNDKYENVNPRANLATIARLLPHSALAETPSERERLLALTTLNIAAGNTDAHAKNFSFLLPPIPQAFEQTSVRLADAYDVVPQVLFETERSPLSMRVNGKSAADQVTSADLIAEATSWGIHPGRVSKLVDQTLRAILRVCEGLPTTELTSRTAQLLHEQTENLLRGDRAWTRNLPQALTLRP